MNHSTTLRHPTTNKLILNAPLCVDDFGNMVFKCQYTGSMVSIDVGIYIGACLPSVSGTYVCAQNAMADYKLHRAAFNEMDANCNTCKSLNRIPHPKKSGGFLYGECAKGITEHQYPMVDGVFMFHPNDPMDMACWEPRA